MKAEDLQVDSCWKFETSQSTYYMRTLKLPIIHESGREKWVEVKVQAVVQPSSRDSFAFKIPEMPYRLDLEADNTVRGVDFITVNQFQMMWVFWENRRED